MNETNNLYHNSMPHQEATRLPFLFAHPPPKDTIAQKKLIPYTHEIYDPFRLFPLHTAFAPLRLLHTAPFHTHLTNSLFCTPFNA